MKLHPQQGLWVCWLGLEDASKACTGPALLAHPDVTLVDRLRGYRGQVRSMSTATLLTRVIVCFQACLHAAVDIAAQASPLSAQHNA